MGSYESIHNDTDAPVVVWFQLLGGGPPNLGYDSEILHPNLKTEPKTFSLGLVHQVCVKFRNPQNPVQQKVMCKKVFSPARADRTNIVQVSDVIGKDTIPLYKDVQVAKAEEKVMEVEAEQQEEEAIEEEAEEQYEKQQEQKEELGAEKQAVEQEDQALEQMEEQSEAQQEKKQQKKQQQAAASQPASDASQQQATQAQEQQLEQMEQEAMQQQAAPQTQAAGPAAAAQQQAAPAMQLSVLHSNHAQGFIPGVLLLVAFMFLLIGFRKLRRFQKILWGSRQSLMDA